jgi:hypothetical protein
MSKLLEVAKLEDYVFSTGHSFERESDDMKRVYVLAVTVCGALRDALKRRLPHTAQGTLDEFVHRLGHCEFEASARQSRIRVGCWLDLGADDCFDDGKATKNVVH